MKEDDFQTLYILTSQRVYGKIRSLGKTPEDSWRLLVELYVRAYRDNAYIPQDNERFSAWAEAQICQLLEGEERENAHSAFKQIDGITEAEQSSQEAIFKKLAEEKMPEEKVTSLWIEIEERLEKDALKPQKRSLSDIGIYSVFKIIAAAGVVIATAALFVAGWSLIHEYRETERAEEAIEQASLAAAESRMTEQEMLRIKREGREIGWTLKEDGNLYYVNKNREEASGALALGGQVFIFSHNGILTSIKEGGGVYNEDTVYYIEDKDVYRKAGGQEKERIVLNGHVTKIEIIDQRLYYICTYQVPNSEEVKTSLWSADLDGENEELLYETMEFLNTDHFQVSGKWYYYLSDGSLLRLNMENGATELMSGGVEQYFVWEDVVYYMDGGMLATVSEGVPYEETEPASEEPQFLESEHLIYEEPSL